MKYLEPHIPDDRTLNYIVQKALWHISIYFKINVTCYAFISSPSLLPIQKLFFDLQNVWNLYGRYGVNANFFSQNEAKNLLTPSVKLSVYKNKVLAMICQMQIKTANTFQYYKLINDISYVHSDQFKIGLWYVSVYVINYC